MSHGQTQFKNFAANEHHGQYQDGEDTNQNQIKNLCPFYIAFQVLKVYTSTLIKICKIHLPNLLGFFVFISFYISRYQFFSNLYRTENFIQHLKKNCHKFSFLNGFTQTPPAPPFYDQNLLSAWRHPIKNHPKLPITEK